MSATLDGSRANPPVTENQKQAAPAPLGSATPASDLPNVYQGASYPFGYLQPLLSSASGCAGMSRIRVIIDNRTGTILTVTKGESMNITYDKEADAAYVHLVDELRDGEASTQVHSIMTPGLKGEIIIDFDAGGRILGVEILGAKDVLREETLALAKRP